MLLVELSAGRFTGSESSGVVRVSVVISGGSASIPVTVQVRPTEQSPLSATGQC